MMWARRERHTRTPEERLVILELSDGLGRGGPTDFTVRVDAGAIAERLRVMSPMDVARVVADLERRGVLKRLSSQLTIETFEIPTEIEATHEVVAYRTDSVAGVNP